MNADFDKVFDCTFIFNINFFFLIFRAILSLESYIVKCLEPQIPVSKEEWPRLNVSPPCLLYQGHVFATRMPHQNLITPLLALCEVWSCSLRFHKQKSQGAFAFQLLLNSFPKRRKYNKATFP